MEFSNFIFLWVSLRLLRNYWWNSSVCIVCISVHAWLGSCLIGSRNIRYYIAFKIDLTDSMSTNLRLMVITSSEWAISSCSWRNPIWGSFLTLILNCFAVSNFNRLSLCIVSGITSTNLVAWKHQATSFISSRLWCFKLIKCSQSCKWVCTCICVAHYLGLLVINGLILWRVLTLNERALTTVSCLNQRSCF